MHGCYLRGFARTSKEITKQRTIRMLCRICWLRTNYGMQHDSENPLSGVTLGFFLRKSRRSQLRTRWKISPRHYNCGKAVPRQVDLKYVGRLLLDIEEGCTWCQILAKIIRLKILEESFCLFHYHVKYYFAHLNSSVSLKPCLLEKFCLHIWIQHKKYC